MSFEIENNLPIYLQLVEQLKMNIISGKLKGGERLPSVRDLALQNKVNPNTMQKALQELETDGLIFTERTNGKFVTDNDELIKKFKEDYAQNLARRFFAAMNGIGYSNQEAIEQIKSIGGNK